jgi:glycosyltransferase involved in cell wall biosynthesis
MTPVTSPAASSSTPNLAIPCVLVMPAYNEEECIAQVVQGWATEFERLFGNDFRMVVVNDGSRDGTGAILDTLAINEPRLRVVHQKNSGHGGALLRGYREAVALRPAYVFHVDSDDQFKPADFSQLWVRRAESPCILGYRSVRHDAFHRLVITRILRLVLLLLYGRYLKDSNIPFRLLERGFLEEALRIIPPMTFAPNIFIAVLGARLDANLMSLPVSHEDRKTGTVSIVRWKLIRVCVRCVGELFGFRRILAENVPALRLKLAHST